MLLYWNNKPSRTNDKIQTKQITNMDSFKVGLYKLGFLVALILVTEIEVKTKICEYENNESKNAPSLQTVKNKTLFKI